MTTLPTLAQLPPGRWLCFSHDPGNAEYHYWQASTKSGLWFVALTQNCTDSTISPVEDGSGEVTMDARVECICGAVLYWHAGQEAIDELVERVRDRG